MIKSIKSTFLFLFVSLFALSLNAQSADEILDAYYEATGGRDAWNKVENMKYTAKVNQGGMEIPIEMVECKDGRSYTKVSFQGLNILQDVYDGKDLWNTNFQTMKAEKATSEDLSNHNLTIGDFPDPLLNYKKRGYKLELLGKESFDGTDAFKLKLTKKPMTVDGKEVEDTEYYYFEAESFVLLGQEMEVKSGPMKGLIQQITFSEYQEVDGLYVAFAMTQGEKGGQSQPIMIEKVELNVELDESIMAFPEEAPVEAPADKK